MTSDGRLELTRGYVAPLLQPSSSAAEVGSELCWNFAMSEKTPELVPVP